jgi:hypothetical protein
MHKPSSDTHSQLSAAPETVETVEPEQDPAGRIVLSGQNRMGARAQVLAGMLLTSGIVTALGALDTTGSLNVHG